MNKYMILFTLIQFIIMFHGATSYPWLEDDDPWVHAVAVRHIAETGSPFNNINNLSIHYLFPYPAFYDIIMSVFYYLIGDMQFTLKFINSVMIALCIPFAFLWFKEIKDEQFAVWASFLLISIPCFMSHFIWAQNLAMLFVFPALYFLEKKEYAYSILATTTSFISQPSVAVMFAGLLAIYSFFKVMEDKDFKPLQCFIVSVFAAFIVFVLPMFMIYGVDRTFSQIGINTAKFIDATDDTSGGVTYSMYDIIVAPLHSKIDQATGIGLFMFILMGLGIAYGRMKENLIYFFWLIYGLVGIEGNYLPLKLFPHRFWVILSIPVVLFGAIGITRLLKIVNGRYPKYKAYFVFFIVLGVLATSMYPKLSVQWAQWPPGTHIIDSDQLSAYIVMKNSLPWNTRVFSFCNIDDIAVGMNLGGHPWNNIIYEYKKHSVNDSIDANYQMMILYQYEYAIIDVYCLKYNTVQEINIKTQELNNDNRFQKVFNNNGAYVYKIVMT